jgi:hypothetical protein
MKSSFAAFKQLFTQNRDSIDRPLPGEKTIVE